MAAKKDTNSLDDIKTVLLNTAKKMLEGNGYPSSELQVQIINSANELIQTAVDIECLQRGE